MGDGLDQNAADLKKSIITPNAFGVVLDIGAGAAFSNLPHSFLNHLILNGISGHGHAAKYLDRQAVSKYIALEPNALMHKYIRDNANLSGFQESDGTLLILACGAEDIDSIVLSLNNAPVGKTETTIQVDTIISILTLCTVPSPQKTIENLVNYLLHPGGKFLIFEHVRSRRSDVAWWQTVLSPIWSLFFDGCKLNRPTDIWISEMKREDESSIWREASIWSYGDEPEEDNMLYHQLGRFVKN